MINLNFDGGTATIQRAVEPAITVPAFAVEADTTQQQMPQGFGSEQEFALEEEEAAVQLFSM
jgi:hypothetical protein